MVGFIMEVCTFLAVLVGIYAGIHFSDGTAKFLKEYWDWDSHYMPIISFVITFLAVGALIFFGGRALQRVVSMVKLSPLNKMLGMVISALKMSYILSVICVFVESMNEKTTLIPHQVIQESLLYEPVKELTGKTIPAFKESLIYWDYWYQNERDSTGLTTEEIVRTKRVADSLQVDIESSVQLLDVYERYVKEN